MCIFSAFLKNCRIAPRKGKQDTLFVWQFSIFGDCQRKRRETLEELQNPEDTPHARIYDRLIEMCTPVRITGENFRKARAREKMEQLKTLLNRKESL